VIPTPKIGTPTSKMRSPPQILILYLEREGERDIEREGEI